MKKIWNSLAKDLWIVLLDIIAVNGAYWLALMIRFYVGSEFRPTVSYLLTDFSHFAPWYTIACIVIFAVFRLYGGMWRYAGMNDMNRIILANLASTLFMVAGTLIFVRRMPISYYVIGSFLQFFMIASIRFAYRLLIVEKNRMGKKAPGAAVLGSGDNARYVLSLLDNGMAFKPVCVIDDLDAGKVMDGLPVYSTQQIEEAVARHDVKCLFLANTELAPEIRKKVHDICEQERITLRDYTSYFTFEGDTDNLTQMRDYTKDRKSVDQRAIPFSPPDISEAEIGEVAEALRSGWITTGPRTKLLERRLAAYIETGKNDVDTEADADRWKNRVVCLNSATAAEELNLRILGIRPGDEVIVPAYTYTASASAAIHCGATVKFVDIQKDGDPVTHCPEMDYDALEKAITEKTKAIITVDLGGVVCDYDRVFKIVESKRNLFTPLDDHSDPLNDLSSRIQHTLGRVAVVADAAHALGASRVVKRTGSGKAEPRTRYVGAIADFTSFSFHAVKNFTTAEGGASAWLPLEGIDNAEIYKMYQLLSLHGQNKDALAKTKLGAWEYDIVGPWYKCNMTDIMAAIGLRQLDRYAGMLRRREQMMQKYDAVCDELGISHMIHHVPGMDSSNHLYLIRVPGISVEQRNKIIEKMAEKGVATNVHYKPMPMMTAYKTLGWDVKDFPNTYDYYHNLVTLPFHTLLSDTDVDFVCKTLKEVVNEVRAC